MTEQLRSDKIAGDCGTVHANESARAAIGSSVDGPRNELFARSRFASYEDRRIAWRDFGDARENTFQSGRCSNNLFEHRCLVDFFSQGNVFVLKPLLCLFAILDVG